MDNPLSQINSLMPIIEKVATDIATQIVTQKLAEAQYNVPKIPDHHHNGSDSIQLEPDAITIFENLPAQAGDVIAPGTIGGQYVRQGEKTVGYTTTTSGSFAQTKGTFAVVPVPAILGGGNSTTYTLTSSPVVGATSGTLTANYVGVTGTYATSFTSSEIKNVLFTNGSAAVSWGTALELNAGGPDISLNGDSVFQGGDAPIGTMVLFSAELSTAPQLWVRINVAGVDAKWWGVELTTGKWGFTA